MGLLSLFADVLFVGQSLVGPTLPPLLETALKQMGEPAAVAAQVIDAAPLSYAWDHADESAQDARVRLAQRPADVVILTEAQPIAATVAANASADAVARFGGLALQANPDARVYVYETWPSLSQTGPSWREQIDLDLPVWETLVRDASAKLGHKVELIPAGQAMAHLADAVAAGQVAGLADIRDVFADDALPNAKGWYFLAMLHAAAITGKSPVGLPAKLTRSWASRDAVIAQDTAAGLQAVAWESLQSYVPAATPAPSAAVLVPAQDQIIAAAPEAAFPTFPPVTNPNLAFNLSSVNDWSVQQPFLDVMKTARPWIGHKPGQWGGWEHADLAQAGALGVNGWPIRIPPEITAIATLVLTDLPADAQGVAGRYVLTYDGNGTLEISGRAQVAAASPGRILFDYTPGEGAVALTITAIDQSDPIRNIVVVREARADLLAKGAIFNPDWLSRLRGVKGLRLMDWMATNNATLAHAADRPLPDDYTYARQGVPVEVLVALANELQANPWFNVPHLADDDLARTYAQIVHDQLAPGLVASVEFSNEVWNWQFTQARWAEDQGKERWGQDSTWVQFYALRAAQVADIWAQVFKDAPDRLQRVVAVQTGWIGLEQQILDAPLVLAEGGAPPARSFDAYAVTGYFSGMLGADAKRAPVLGWLGQSEQAAQDQVAAQGLKGAAAASFLAEHRYDLADQLAAQEVRDGSLTGDASDSLSTILTQVLPYHAAVAADHGLKLVMYEGGSHVVGFGPQIEDAALADFFVHFNYTAEMAALYAQMMAGWQTLTDQPFTAFSDVARPGKWGSWGALRHLGDDNPRWQVLAKGCLQC